MLGKIDKIEHDIEDLKEELDYIKNILEDSILTEAESKLVEDSINKIKIGNKSDFFSLSKAKGN